MKKLYNIVIKGPDIIRVMRVNTDEAVGYFYRDDKAVGHFYRDEMTQGKFSMSYGLSKLELDKHPRELYTREQAIDVILNHNAVTRKRITQHWSK